MSSRSMYCNISLVSDFLTSLSEFLSLPSDVREDSFDALRSKASEFGQTYDCSDEKSLLSDIRLLSDVALGMIVGKMPSDVSEVFSTLQATLSGNLANARPDDALDIVGAISEILPKASRAKMPSKA